MLLLGTENCELLVLNKSCMEVDARYELPAVPVFIESRGCYDVESKILVGCRNGFTYLIKNRELQELKFHIPSKPLGLVYLEKSIVVGGMDRMIYSYFHKGSLNFSKEMPDDIICMAKVEVKRREGKQALAVSLRNGEVHIFVDKNLLHVIKMAEPITGIKFGVYGREEGFLIMNSASGGIYARVLARQA